MPCSAAAAAPLPPSPSAPTLSLAAPLQWCVAEKLSHVCHLLCVAAPTAARPALAVPLQPGRDPGQVRRCGHTAWPGSACPCLPLSRPLPRLSPPRRRPCRPTEASHFWRDAPRILGGRDLVAGGTWFAVDAQSGRLALLTNFREVRPQGRGPCREGHACACSLPPSPRTHPPTRPPHCLQLRDKALSAPSRGALPVSFVSGGEEPAAFLAGLDSRAYPGFNLLAADVPARRMAYMCRCERGWRGPAGPACGPEAPAWVGSRRTCNLPLSRT